MNSVTRWNTYFTIAVVAVLLFPIVVLSQNTKNVLHRKTLEKQVFAEQRHTGPGTRPSTNDVSKQGAPKLSSLRSVLVERGLIYLSLDAAGTNNDSATIQVQKPSGATVRKAYLFAASTGFTGREIANGDITLNGVGINWDAAVVNGIGSNNYIADVTSIVQPTIDAAPAGIVDFTIRENGTTGIDGEILAVIFDDPNQSQEKTVALFFGAQLTTGDQFNIGLDQVFDPNDPNSRADFSLGISYGYQLGSNQYSIVDVNGQRLTSSAGGEDDGDHANGALITVGGIGDSTNNPADPYQVGGADPRYDDELYNLKPFMNIQDQTITVSTLNPSYDDNIFFAALFITVPVTIGTGEISGYKFFDDNQNGVWDEGESPIENWMMSLEGPTSSTTYTDYDGRYVFTNLLPGSYVISEDLPFGWKQTYPDSPYVHIVQVDSGGTYTTMNFGNYSPPSYLSGMKFHDLNGNGVRDTNEVGIPNWWIYVYGNSTYYALTDSNGYYSVEVPLGSYSVYEEGRFGWEQTLPEYGYYYVVIDTPGTVIDTLDFGNVEGSGEIHGMKFNDRNGNGIKDPNEAGIPGWKISLYLDFKRNTHSGGGYVAYTDSLGRYRFTNLTRGYYYLYEESQEGWQQTYPEIGYWVVHLDSIGKVVTNIDFGNHQEGPRLVLDRECMSFATVPVGQSLTLPLQIMNDGSTDLVVDAIYADTGFVVLLDSGFTLSPGQWREVEVMFVPHREGHYAGGLVIINNDDSVRAVILTGQGELHATGTGQQIFSGLVTVNGIAAPRYTVVAAFRTNQELIKSTIVWVHPDSIHDNVNYALSILEGQAGLVAGDTIIFVVGTTHCELLPEQWCDPYFTTFNPSFPPEDGYTRHDVRGVHPRAAQLNLLPGLNAVSWNVQTKNFIPTQFASLLETQKVQIILDLVRDPRGKPHFNFFIPRLGQHNPLQFTHYKKGYLFKLFNNAEPETFDLWGIPTCADNPIPLLQGLNLVSYLPTMPDSVGHALSSIASILDVAVEVRRDSAGNLEFAGYPNGDFTMMEPGKGYFVRVNNAGVLTYPASVSKAPIAHEGSKPHAVGFNIPQAMFVYGDNVRIDGVIVPQGTAVRAVDRDGIMCGEGQFIADGVYALGIYGDDPDTPEDEGAQLNEQVTLYIDNKQVEQSITWTGFANTFELGGDIIVLDARFSDLLPKEFAVHQNYPNPFNPTTLIKYELPASSLVSLKIYDMLGREVRTLVSGEQPAGYHQVVWDGRNESGHSVATGIYTYRFTAGDYIKTQKMMLMK